MNLGRAVAVRAVVCTTGRRCATAVRGRCVAVVRVVVSGLQLRAVACRCLLLLVGSGWSCRVRCRPVAGAGRRAERSGSRRPDAAGAAGAAAHRWGGAEEARPTRGVRVGVPVGHGRTWPVPGAFRCGLRPAPRFRGRGPARRRAVSGVFVADRSADARGDRADRPCRTRRLRRVPDRRSSVATDSPPRCAGGSPQSSFPPEMWPGLLGDRDQPGGRFGSSAASKGATRKNSPSSS